MMTRARTERTATWGRVAAAAEVAVRASAVDAVLLYGSRARGEEHEYSDWDVAAVGDETEEALARAGQAFEHLDEVNVVALAADDIERHRHDPMRVECGIAHEARVLAGTWHRPRCKPEDLHMDEETLRWALRRVRYGVQGAIGDMCSNIAQGDRYNPELVESSHKLAERVAKGICASFARRVGGHNLETLAKRLREAHPTNNAPEDLRLAFADDVEALNNTRNLHTAGYAIKGQVEPHEHTLTRIHRALALHTRWIEWYARHDPMARSVVAEEEGAIHTVLRTVEVRDEFAQFVETRTGSRFLEWARAQKDLARACAREQQLHQRKMGGVPPGG